MSQSIERAIPDNKAYRAQHRGVAKSCRYLPSLDPFFSPARPPFATCDTQRLGIYPVVDSVEWIKKLVPLGVSTIQLRIKDKDAQFVDQAIKDAVAYCVSRSVRLFINDYWALAIKHGAYGVHLGQEDLEQADLAMISSAGLRLGLSSHSWAEIARAFAIKPSYLALGPIYATTSKQMPWRPHGEAWVKRWVTCFDGRLPLVAIGGIDFARATKLKATGVGSVAMISSITHAPDFAKATQALLSLWEE